MCTQVEKEYTLTPTNLPDGEDAMLPSPAAHRREYNALKSAQIIRSRAQAEGVLIGFVIAAILFGIYMITIT